MAKELTITAAFEFLKSSTSLKLSDEPPFVIDVAGNGAIKYRQSVGFAAEEALLVPAEITVLGYFIGINRDATNFIEIRAATGLQDLIILRPGKLCIFEFAPLCTAPFVQADTADCELEYILLEL